MPSTRKTASIRAHIALLIAVVLAPTLLFSGVLLVVLANSERARIEQDSQDTVHALATAVDRELVGLEFTLRGMSVSPSLKSGDWKTFHQFAVDSARWRQGTFVLRSLNSVPLVNSAIAWGEPLPTATTLRDEDQEVLKTGDVVVSDAFVGLVVTKPLFAVVAPIKADDKITGFLSLSVPTTTVTDIVSRLTLSPEQVAFVFDSRQGIIARSGGAGGATPATLNIGIPATGPYLGVVHDVRVDGVSSATFYQRSAVSDWTMAISVPEEALGRPLRQSLYWLIAIGICLTTLSVLAAWTVSRRFAGPIRALARNAERISRDEPIEYVEPHVLEIRQVADALERSSDTLIERSRERDVAQSKLQELNANLENQVALRTGELQATNRQLVGEIRRSEENEAKIRQLQKIEAVGQLTGGIAHDFNNMLAVILSSLNLIKRRLERGDSNIGSFVDAAVQGGERAAQLTSRLLAFSRQQPLSPTPADANKLVAGMSGLLRGSIPESIEIEIVHGGGLWRIHIDQNQMENVLLNLAVNARDAMPSGGKLTIETSNAYLDEAYAAQHSEVSAGQHVLVAITDNGSGMPEAVIEKAFDPFFTTKSTGQGTGLGLSQVHGFVKQSGGHVKIYSELGHGTTVKMYFPRFVGALPDTEAARTDETMQPSKNGELILLVEDDEQVRSMSRAMLDELGYRVIEADGGAAALRQLETNPDISLLLTDVVMPAMNGRQLADAARILRPELKVIFTTGYTRNAIIHNGVLDAGVHLLIKPFTLNALAAKLQDVL